MESTASELSFDETAQLLMAPDDAWERNQGLSCAFCSPYCLGISSLS